MQYLDFEQPIAELEGKIEELKELSNVSDGVLDKEIQSLKKRVDKLRESIFSNLTRWQRVQLARHPDRPYTLDYIYKITENFVELHGDRYHADDKAIVGGLATIDGQSVMIIGHQKGRDTNSRKYRNFGMANPEGYRKAHRLMKLAEKFDIPIITLLDTPGAYPGLEAEERGQAEAIAKNLKMMAMLKVPFVTIVIGEGASGGAIGIGMGNEVYMMENTWYSVISPESCSSILWKTWDYKEQAAAVLKLTAVDLEELDVIDGVIPEPMGGAHRDHDEAASALKKQILQSLKRLKKLKPEKLIEQRIDKYAAMGEWKVVK
ncbi:MAG: acetyl-CoA carboxylase carboxyltransferase subunit alpha [Gracilimonas sp.]|uniref:acetyl-CoA carboxylase carboxyltransferase subunit alpha n=1 Tax=Gracilimonas TaxID=649462 RepID=UPI001B272A48|nr:acetyl-CoA carboxylase carboxyltransferase subunit alpha [Gracilimonas sp.]MBO6587417.1 acetyl-CoA carboxylase carboxyltransferase subunit alpha [Gracilimonas sp.]MBO6614097.1 acetyl-CoA carboxylase carboxyltransferase subunit alpha [Gracilimonas sp.]